MSLEQRISSVALAVRTVERAFHDPLGWSFRWGPHVLPATVVATERGVTFSAEVPEMCYLTPVDEPVTLWHRDDMLGARQITHPGDAAFGIDWELSLDLLAAA